MAPRMWSTRLYVLVIVGLMIWLWWPWEYFGASDSSEGLSKKPNIILVLTDDQDLHMDSLSYMPFLNQHIAQQGTSFNSHYCTVSICCPSRVSLLTGKAAHNTNVTDVAPPYGGYQKFVEQGLNNDYLPIWLQEQGYNTYYIGKLMNGHGITNYRSPYAKGWTGSDFLLDPSTYTYVKSVFQRNKQRPRHYFDHYSTDVIAEKTYGFLEEGARSKKPFFMFVAPIAPHATFEVAGWDMKTYAPISAKRHRHLFNDTIVPRTPNFNPDEGHGVDWISELPKLTPMEVDAYDEFHRQRLRSLQAVDEMIDGIVQRLTDHDILENTYIFYSTDNGYHIGQHRLFPGKECGFEDDIHIPMIVRGPGVPKGESTGFVTTHTDLAPTFMSLVGATLREDFDGLPMPLTSEQLGDQGDRGSMRPENVNIEFWGIAFDEFGEGLGENNTYKGLRLIGKDYDLYYAVWCSNSHELYDLKTDPYQNKNIYPTGASGLQHLLGMPIAKVLARLDALLLVLKGCKGTECTYPWQVLHPHGRVKNLLDALHPTFDEFYEVEQKKVSFSWCAMGYLRDAEGPQKARIFRDRDRLDNLL